MIIKEIDKNLKSNKIEDFCELPIVVYVNKFDEASAKTFQEDMSKAESTFQDVIPIVIDSYGGSVYSLLSMIDVIKSSKKKIATICLSKAMSCGVILLSCGDQGLRFISPNSTTMIHSVSSMTWGKLEDMKVDVSEADRLNNIIFSILDKNCQKNDGYFKQIIKDKMNADWFLSASDTLYHNIANHIRLPTFKVKVSLNFSLEPE